MAEGREVGDRSEAIRKIAYAIWMDEGCVDGRDKEHWAEAERQVDAEASTPTAPAPPIKRSGGLKQP